MSDLIDGLYPKPKSEKAPDFVIGKLSINVSQFREWMINHIQAHPGEEWINIDMKVSKAGKGYAVLDTWKPDAPSPSPESAQTHAAASAPPADLDDTQIPF